MLTLFFLVKTLFSLAIYLFILRLWMQYQRVNFHNPITQAIVKITEPVVKPLRFVLPTWRKVDTATAFVVYLLALLKTMLLFRVMGNPLWLPAYLWIALCAILHAIGYLTFWLLLIRAILSWVSNGYSAIEEMLIQLTEPLAAPVRRWLKPIGGVDFSFMVIVFILMLFNMLAYDYLGAIWSIL